MPTPNPMPDNVAELIAEAEKQTECRCYTEPQIDCGVDGDDYSRLMLNLANALTVAYSTPEPTSEHFECDCVPDIGPSHRHACHEVVGREVPWSEAQTLHAVTPQPSEATNPAQFLGLEGKVFKALSAVGGIKQDAYVRWVNAPLSTVTDCFVAALPQFTAPVPSIEAIAEVIAECYGNIDYGGNPFLLPYMEVAGAIRDLIVAPVPAPNEGEH